MTRRILFSLFTILKQPLSASDISDAYLAKADTAGDTKLIFGITVRCTLCFHGAKGSGYLLLDPDIAGNSDLYLSKRTGNIQCAFIRKAFTAGKVKVKLTKGGLYITVGKFR